MLQRREKKRQIERAKGNERERQRERKREREEGGESVRKYFDF